MNKTTFKKTFAKQINAINTANSKININMWKRAKAFKEISDKFSYSAFIDKVKEVFPHINPNSAYIYACQYNTISSYYNWKDIELISKEISYSRAYKVALRMPKVLSVQEFIKVAKSNAYTGDKHNTVSNPNTVVFRLNDEDMSRLNTILYPHGGYTTKSGRRVHYSSAMSKFLKKIHP